MTVLIAEPTTPSLTPDLPMEVTEDERITCDQCDAMSPYFYDGDGEHDAYDAGWHTLYRDDCDCPVMCRDCAQEWCGQSDSTPRLYGMRVV
ncbi:hypothetical protein ACFV9E_36040 [Streptomyces sp. NPDC059835]|uniref:hypothetical protein n=1 Tax=Streptomyces sp. NPDC059835 TaxID=3346967 RepID=UPI003666DE21